MKTVIIVGAGPVGAMAACYMARRSVHVEVFEMRKDLRFSEAERKSSSALTISYRGLEALRGINLEKDVINEATPMYGDVYHETSGRLRTMTFGKTENIIYCVDRHKLNQVLISAAEKYKNVNLHFEHKLLECDLDRCSATFQRSDGSILNVNGDIIIGCDGAFSTVRRQMMRRAHFNYSQFYIPHEYVEFTVPPSEEKECVVEHNYGHIWFMKECAMFTHPNRDKSATVSVLLPKEMTHSLKKDDGVVWFFREYFEDMLPLIERENLVETITKAKSYPIVTIKCTAYHYYDRAVLLGDAAHAMVPLYGQGINCLTQPGDWGWSFWRDSINSCLSKLFPGKWVPLYTSVVFTRKRYQACIKQNNWQNQMVKLCEIVGLAFIFIGGCYLHQKYL